MVLVLHGGAAKELAEVWAKVWAGVEWVGHVPELGQPGIASVPTVVPQSHIKQERPATI